MQVFLTGAGGFVGSYLVPELVRAGHRVTGLARSDAGARALSGAGAEVVRGDVNDLALLPAMAASFDAIVHAAFDHDPSRLQAASEEGRRVVATFGEIVAGTDRPLLVTSGTGLVRPAAGAMATESDAHLSAAEFPRGACEEAADVLIERSGDRGRVMVIRLPQVHDTRRQGRITRHIELARQKGRVAYVGEGTNRLPAVHVADAARLYRLALERGQGGARYHAVAEEGVALRDIAAVIGAGLAVPVESIAAAEAPEYFGPLANLAQMDLAAGSAWTRQELSWRPEGPDLLTDLRNMDYQAR